MIDKHIIPKKHLENIYRTPLDKRDRQQFLRLDKNEDPVGLPEEFLDKAFCSLTPSFISSYPQPYQLYEKISKWLRLAEDSILITSGSDAAIKTAFEVFVEPGNGVILPDPTYAMFDVYGQLFQADIERINYKNDLSLSIDEMKTAITEETKLVALANPNSPTGTVVGREEIEGLVEKADRTGTVVLIDEAYYPFHTETMIDLASEYENLIVTRTFSKAFRLASIRLGFAVAHPKTIEALRKFRPMYEVNSFAVLLGCAILDDIDLMHRFVKEVEEGKRYLEDEIRKLGLTSYQTHANFLLINVGDWHVENLVNHMQRTGILISGKFTHPALKDCIRISLGPKKQMKLVVDALHEYF